MSKLADLLKQGQEELEAERLEDAEQSFGQALDFCASEEDRQEVLRCLLKISGKYLRLKVQNRPKVLFEHIQELEVPERARVMEWLARIHQQTDDLAGAERIYTEIFELLVRLHGVGHPDVMGALKTAALLCQMQGKSSEELYLKAYEISKAVAGACGVRPPQKLTGRETQDVVIQAVSPKRPPGWDEKRRRKHAGTEPPRDKADKSTNKASQKKESDKRASALHMLDELLGQSSAAQADESIDEPAAEFIVPPLTLELSLQELIAAWEPFCDAISARLLELLQNKPAYAGVLEQYSSLLKNPDQLKQVDIENPFMASARRAESNALDWQILRELQPVYAAYDGEWENYPFEISLIYACLRRAFCLGPLHIDTMQSIYRLAHLYANEMFGCYDLSLATSAYRICVLAFRQHPEIDGLTRIRAYTNMANMLMAANELNEAKEYLKEAIKQANICAQMNDPELLSILKSLADCLTKLEDYETAAAVLERVRNFQEAVSRDTGLFETLVQLFSNYKRAGKESQSQAYQQRLYWELDWLENPNPMRESIAKRAFEMEQYELAEFMLNDIIANCKPFEPLAGRAALSLMMIYEKTGRAELAERLKYTG